MELKPCPFCGKQPTTRWDISEPHYEEGYNIDCCCVHISRIFKEDAVEVWNSRHPNQAMHSDGDKTGQFNVELKISELPKWKSTSKF